MIVGEAPGRRGAGRTGLPFWGDESGRRLEMFLELAGLSREGIFITNSILCNRLDSNGRIRPPFLKSQVDIIEPEVVITLGRVALEALQGIEPHDLRLQADCGRDVDWYGRRLIPLYHVGRRASVHRPEPMQKADLLELEKLLRRLDLKGEGDGMLRG